MFGGGLDPSMSMMSKSSHSQSVAGSVMTSKTGLSSALDPLFDKITQSIQLPSLIYMLAVLINYIQLMYVSIWDSDNEVWLSNKISREFQKYYHQVCCFTPHLDSDSNYLIAFIVYLAIFVIIFGALAIQILVFKKVRRFNKKSLYPTRICLELLPLILVCPLASYTGDAFAKVTVFKEDDAVSIVLFVISLVEYIITVSFFYYCTSIIGCSAYYSLSPFMAFSFGPFVRVTTISSVFLLLSRVFQFFPKWTINALMLIHAVYMVFFFLQLFRRPFIRTSSNVIYLSIAYASIAMDVSRFVTAFIKDANGLIYFVLFFVYIILAIVGAFLFYFFQDKKMSKYFLFLNEDGTKSTEVPSDDERMDRLTSLQLDQNEAKALQCLDYITAHNITAYLDFFLIKFIIQYHHSINALCHCIRILACFPPQSRNLNLLFNEAVQHRDMSFTHRFFLMQVQKIKLLRQSASSTQAGERMKDLKQQTKELESTMQNFWLMPQAEFGFLIGTGNRLKKTNVLWDESLAEFPNSIQYIEESTNFLIECSTDFVEAVKSKHKIDLIEAGKNFNVDMCFRQFVRTFPAYFKSKVIDLKGNFIFNQKVQKGANGNQSVQSTNSNSNEQFSSSSSSSSMSELEVAVEEGIGKMLINQSKIRLALQRATETRKANTHTLLVLVTILLFLAALVLSIFILVFFNGYYDERLDTTERIKKVNQARLYMFETNLMLIYLWGNNTGSLELNSYMPDIWLQDKDYNVYEFMPNISYEDRAMLFVNNAKDFYSDFLIDVASQSRAGVNMYQYTAPIFEESTNMSFTRDGIVYPPKLYNLKTVMIFTFMLQRLLIGDSLNPDSFKDWYITSRNWGTLITTAFHITTPYDEITNSLSSMSIDDAESADKMLEILKISLPIAFGVISVVLFIVVSVFYIREIKKFTGMLLTFPIEVKKASMLPIRKTTTQADQEAEIINSGESSAKNAYIVVALIIAGAIFFIAIAIFFFLQLLNIDNYNIQYSYLNLWSKDSRVRKSYVAQLTVWISQAILYNSDLIHKHEPPSTFLDLDTIRAAIETDVNELSLVNKDIFEDTDVYPSGSGVDDEIDQITFSRLCQPLKNTTSFHALYRCGSVQNLLNFFLNIVDQALAKLDQYDGKIKDELPSNLLHLANCHLIPRLLTIDERWTEVANIFRNRYTTNHIIYMALELICEFIALIICCFLIKTLSESYAVVLTLLRRVNPIAIVAHEELINYILEKSTSHNSGEMSTEQGIIYNSSDCVICLGPTGMVDILNPSVSRELGFTPEQLLGQPVEMIFDEESKSKTNGQLELMRNRQSAPTFEDHVICVSDDDSKIPFEITIIAMISESNEVSSFVMILRNESELVEQQKVAEEAKKTSENLLYQILPRSIVVRLNQGEKDISFTVPSATIMFIDIVKFSEYAASLTPQEIMGNLSLIFAGFDELITKYELLTKIKLIGDVYMCAGGLFTPDEPPVSHAEQMTKFGLDCLQALEDANVKLTAMLNVRIGINTGGPLIAGVLGTDKPTFDIIGDPINISSRLQSTDIPGKIQISQNTYDLINGLDFMIEERGEVFLKGKGKQLAYLVSSTRPFTITSSSPNEAAANWGEKE